MADNDTSVASNSAQSVVQLIGRTAVLTSYWILCITCLIPILYGVISWCIIKKFRHYKNYVILSAIVANMLRIFMGNVPETFFNEMTLESFIVLRFMYFLLTFCYLSHNCWLLVLCYIFYVDFVKVFSFNFHNRFLKSSLIGWGVPFVTTCLYFLVGLSLYAYDNSIDIIGLPIAGFIIIFPLIVNFIIYLTVVYSLFRTNKSGMITSTNKWRRFYICTLIFVFSDVTILITIFQLFQVLEVLATDVISMMGEYLNALALNVYIIVVKSNRDIWRDFLNKRRLKHSSLIIKPVEPLLK